MRNSRTFGRNSSNPILQQHSLNAFFKYYIGHGSAADGALSNENSTMAVVSKFRKDEILEEICCCCEKRKIDIPIRKSSLKKSSIYKPDSC